MSENIIKNLEPKILWQRFYEMTRVPRPSKKEEKIIEHMKNLLKDLNVEFKEDNVGNILAKVPATPGLENSPTVILQGHVDMVCEKNKSKNHDFEKDPIELIKEDGWITADGTTLGGDNGIGVSAALAVITDKEVEHGPIEILMTVDEETGMTGASNINPGFMTGKILLNMDSEEEGTFYVGCSGGMDTVAEFTIETENTPENFIPYELLVTGLKGGHSGLDIVSGRANAIKLLARTLKNLEQFDFHIAKISGGSLRNAIPREAEAEILIKQEDESEMKKILGDLKSQFLNEFKKTDSNLNLIFKKSGEKPGKVFTKNFKKKITDTLLALPHGVIAMSQDIPDLVETSTNLATVVMNDSILRIDTSQRSSINSAKQYVVNNVKAVLELAGANVRNSDGYPGWKPNLDSQILKVSKDVYKKLFNKEPEVKAIHAGLETGLLGDKNPGIDMISFGPTIVGAHSPDEKVNIETVGKFYELLKGILKSIAVSKN
ncbi:MAG: aminoacyl-histidine dipeptidase [Ignavibacteriaceae bacterium]